MNLALRNYFAGHPWAGQFSRNCAITAGINLLIALFLTYLTNFGYGLRENLVFSFCIGTLTWLFIDGGRLLIWGPERPTRFSFFLLCFVSIIGARILGDMLAVRILDIPISSHVPVWEQNTPRFFILTVWICICIVWFFWNRGRIAFILAQCEAEKARAAAIEKQAMLAQLQALQTQIEPHMLFNTLANLQGMIAIDPPRAQHMLEQLIVFLRSTLSSSRAERIALADEFALMQAYLELMSVRMGARLSYALQLPDALRQVQVPPMLLQPLVENAIKHGLEPKIEGGRIEIKASVDGDRLKLEVYDTGLGLGDEAGAGIPGNRSTHVGLANIRERLKALYGDAASFSLSPNSPCGAAARLNLPAPDTK